MRQVGGRSGWCDGVIINVASNEYFKGVSKHLKSRVITCEFKDGGRVISVFAKRARGLMVKFAVQQRIQTVEDVKKFDLEGYSYSEKDSSDDVFVFSRAKSLPRVTLPRERMQANLKKNDGKYESKGVFILGGQIDPKVVLSALLAGVKI